MRALGLWRVLGFYTAMGAVGWAGMTSPMLLLPPATLRAWSLTVGLGVGTGLLLVMASRWATMRLVSMGHMAREFRGMYGEMAAREALTMACLSGVSEEILFRGALQPSVGLGCTAVIFGLLHVRPSRRFIPWTIMAVVGGLVFGLLALWTEHILAPILAHITVNFLNLRFLASARLGVELRASALAAQRAARS
ncbi:MAG TPA: CPBP family intramembrane glutamic endopeptidase [Myxococcota bacterium]|nr:CPBP family intramembrane glutamic endopeptidase [Myxococcota bacterium]